MRQLLPVEAKNHRWGTGATTALVALPILYALSIGPIVYVFERYRLPVDPKTSAAFDAFYTPIRLLGKHTPLGKPLWAYIEWWADLGRKP